MVGPLPKMVDERNESSSILARWIGTYSPGSDEWHGLRKGRIGGSDIGTLLGWSPFSGREDLMLSKLGITGPKGMSPAMARGNFLEDGVAQWLAHKLGLGYDEERSKGTYLHDEYDWALFNPDRLTTCGRLVEIKTTNNRTVKYEWGEEGTNLVPLTYQAQVQWGMGILGLTESFLGVLAGALEGRPNLHFAYYVIPFEEQVFEWELRQAKLFHEEYVERSQNG